MLQTIRDRAQGWIAGAIVALVSIPFALWGVHSYFDSSGEVVVASIDGEDLTLKQFQQTLQTYKEQLQASAGGTLNVLDQNGIKEEVLDRIIEQKVVEVSGHKLGLRVSDDQVAAQVHAIDAFKQGGTFSKETYEQRLRATGLTPIVFEERLRREMLADQLRQGISDTSFATSADVDRYAKLVTQTRDIVYAVISAEPLKSQIQVSDDQIDKYYKDNASRFKTKETVDVSYIELSVGNLAKNVVVDEQKLHEYYEANRANFTLPEERNAEYMLVAVPKDAPDDVVKAAEAKARSLLEKAMAGAKFDDIAAAEEAGGGPSAEGGQTGFVRQGVLPEPVDKAVFALKPGDLSDVVRSDFGFHVMRLIETRPGNIKSFEEAREDVDREYRREQAEKQFYEQAEQLANLAFESPDSLDPAAKSLGLEVRQSGPITIEGGEGLFADPKVLDAAFSTEVLNDGVNSEPIELSGNRAVVLHLKEHQPSVVRPLDEVRAEIVDAVKAETAAHQTTERGEALLKKLTSGESRDALASAEGLEWKTAENVGRSDPNVARAVVRDAFRLGRPQSGSPIYSGIPLGTGDFALVGVLAVKDGDPAKITQESLQQARSELTRLYGEEAWEVFQEQARAATDIEIHPDRMKL